MLSLGTAEPVDDIGYVECLLVAPSLPSSYVTSCILYARVLLASPAAGNHLQESDPTTNHVCMRDGDWVLPMASPS